MSLLGGPSDDDELLRDHGGSGGGGGNNSERQKLLDNSDDDDGDFFLNGPKVNFGNARLQGLRAQVDEVQEVVRENVARLADRGQALDQLDRRAEDLEGMAGDFNRGAG